METGGFFGENADLLRTYAAHVAILALKMAAIVVMTIRARLKYKVRFCALNAPCTLTGRPCPRIQGVLNSWNSF